MAKVYWIGLALTMNATRRYIQRNQQRLESNLNEAQYECVVAVLDAILTCLSALPAHEETP